VEEGVTRILADNFSWGTFPDAIRFIGNHPHLLWHKSLEHLQLSGAALGIALLVALPLGVVLGHLHRGSFVAISVSNIGRALPSLVLIAFALLVSGHFFLNNTAALVVLGVPPILTNAYFAVEQIDANIVEAARGMGMRGHEILLRVELPLAAPLIFAGIRIAAVFVIATATIASIAAGHGLGDIIVNQATYRLSGVLGASLCVMVLSAAVFLGLVGLQAAVTPKGVRRTRVAETSGRKEQA
jgi:osmoprotectant transport system permease protein